MNTTCDSLYLQLRSMIGGLKAIIHRLPIEEDLNDLIDELNAATIQLDLCKRILESRRIQK